MRVRGGRGEPRNILVTRLRYLGDVILTTPVVAALANIYPGATIDYLCEHPFDQALRGNPHIRRCLVLDKRRKGESWRIFQELRGHYDLLIDLFSNPRSALLCGLSGAPTRVGGGSFPRSLMYNVRPEQGPEYEPSTLHHLRYLETICGSVPHGDPSFHVSGKEIAEGRRILEDRSLGDNTIAILTGASWPTREWPPSYFVRLAAQIEMEGRYRPVFLGQPGKRDRLEAIRNLSNSRVTILPECGIRVLAGLLANCRALVCPDGGVMHMAIAMGIPTLAIFGSTESRIWFPYLHLNHATLAINEAHCRPCHQRECADPFCTEGLLPEDIFSSLQDLLSRTEV